MKYEIGHIYAIWDCEDHNLVYYGSTNMIFEERIYRHKNQGNTSTSKKIIERGNYEYAILETHENIDEYDLRERERWYILNKPCVNKLVPNRTRDEYYQDNKDELQKLARQYYQDHKDERNEYMREYHQNHKDERKEYGSKYRQEHKQYFKEYNSKYYKQNYNDKYRQINKQKVRCPYCDKEMSKSSLTRHLKKFCKGQNHSSTLT